MRKCDVGRLKEVDEGNKESNEECQQVPGDRGPEATLGPALRSLPLTRTTPQSPPR